MIRDNYLKIGVVFFLTCILCVEVLFTPVFVHATDKEETQLNISALKERIMVANNEISNLYVKKSELEKGISELKAETQIRTKKLDQLEKESAELEREIQERAQAIQLQESNDRLGRFKSNGINKTISIFYLLEKIRKQDEEKAQEYGSLIKKIEEEKKAIDEKESEYHLYQKDLEIVLLEQEKEKQYLQKELDENVEILEQVKKTEELAEEKNSINQEKVLNNLEKNSNLTNPLVEKNGINEQGQQIIAFTKEYLGVPYVWGGTTPNGFDCSGLMQWVFAHNGIQIPRVSQDQQQFAEKIPIEDIRPGDLVFWGSPAYHVGLYIGEGYYIHAPQPGDVVKITHNSYYPFESAGRVIL